jgi:hypothetical protein
MAEELVVSAPPVRARIEVAGLVDTGFPGF